MHGQSDSALCCRSLCSSTPFVHSKLNTCTSTQRNILGVSPPGSPLHHLLSSVTSGRNTAPTPHILDKKRHLLLFPLQLEVERTGTGRPTPCMITGRSSLTGHKTLSLLSTLYLAVFTMGERFHSRPACIGPSVLASDMSRLMEETLDVEKQGADYIHLDVMDGHFVPNLTFGAPVIKGLRKHTKALLDAHLMVSHPAQWVDDMAAAGVDRFTFHVEATDKVSELIEAVKAKGMGVGLALKPGTPVEDVFPYCKELDLVLVMTVEPGFGGQSFMSDQMSKVKELRRRYPDLDIEVDGGLADNTIEEAATAGANLIVCGSYIFKGNKAERINLLKKAVEKYGNGKADKDLTPCVVVESGEKRPKTLAA